MGLVAWHRYHMAQFTYSLKYFFEKMIWSNSIHWSHRQFECRSFQNYQNLCAFNETNFPFLLIIARINHELIRNWMATDCKSLLRCQPWPAHQISHQIINGLGVESKLKKIRFYLIYLHHIDIISLLWITCVIKW